MKRFVISEDERRRILSMHKSATKRQYLSEQPATTPNSGVTRTDAVTSKPNFAQYIPTNAERDAFITGLNNISSSTEEDLITAFYEDKFANKLRTILSKTAGYEQFLPTSGETWKEWYVDNKLGSKNILGDITIDIGAAEQAVKQKYIQAAKMYDFDAIDKALTIMYQYAKQTENPTTRDPNFKTMYRESGLSNDILMKANHIGQIAKLIGAAGDLTPMKNLS